MIKFFGKHALNIKANKPIDKKYHKLHVDEILIVEEVPKYDHKKLLEDYFDVYVQELKPVKTP